MKTPLRRARARGRGPVLLRLVALVAVALLADAGPAPPQVRAPRASSPDLVLITIDTLRADALGFAGNTQVATPNLDRLAAEGLVFTDAHAHNVVTLPSHANILTGLYPFQHGVRDNSGFRLAATHASLASVLHDAGYATGGFVSGFPLEARFGLGRGFEVYDDRFSNSVRDEEFQLAERRGDEAVAAALAWWRAAAAAPRFLWLHLFDPHAPYVAPEPYASRYRAQPYYGEVAAVDAFLAPLLAELRASGARPVALLLTSDHGEALGDHGEKTHGLFCYESTLKVPLLLWGAGIAAGRDTRPARHVDIFPTLLALAGVRAPAAPADVAGLRPGSPLVGPVERLATGSYFEALSTTLNRGWAPLRGRLRNRTKAIALPLPELYDLATDPAEVVNLVDRQRRLFNELAATLPVESKWPPQRGVIGDEERARLAALGYLSSNATAPARWGVGDDPKSLLALDGKIFATVEAFSNGRTAEALALARAIVAERPAMALGRALLAQTLLESGRRQEALAEMRRARADGVTTDGLLRQLSQTLSEEGQSAEALAVLAALVAAGDLDARIARALALSEGGRNEEARRELEAILAAHPNEPHALENAALVALRLGRPTEARELARRAVERSPGLARAWNDLGVALFQLGELDAALAAWTRAVAADPRLWDALWNLGLQSARAGRLEAARRALAAFANGAPAERYRADKLEAQRILDALPRKPG